MLRILTFLTLTLLLGACSKTPDEEQIAQNIAAIEAAVEAKSFTDIEAFLHDDFLANEQMSARDAGRLLQVYGRQHRRLGVTIIGTNTTMDEIYPDRAETTLSVVVTGSAGRLPTDGSARTVRVEWLKDGGDWLIRRARWER